MRCFGVDFSGAADAGRKIWIASAESLDQALRVIDLRRAAELPGGAVEREPALTALRTFVAAQGGALFGFDFPFSLSRDLIPFATWDEFAARFEHDYPDADALYAAGRARPVARRLTDIEAKTPFAPHNLRLYRQTYYGIRDLLAPLVASGAACALPMQPARPGVPWLLEICPASWLKAAGCYRPYKGKTEAHRRQREAILAALDRLSFANGDLREQALADTEGDALDAVIAAYVTARCAASAGQPATDARYRLEGKVYV